MVSGRLSEMMYVPLLACFCSCISVGSLLIVNMYRLDVRNWIDRS